MIQEIVLLTLGLILFAITITIVSIAIVMLTHRLLNGPNSLFPTHRSENEY